MRLVRYEDAAGRQVGLVDAAGDIRSLSEHVSELAGDALAPSALAKLADIDPASLPIAVPVRLLPPVSGTQVFLGVGLNYHDHAEETQMDLPTEPLLFQKAVRSIAGPHDDVVMPRGSMRLDHEVELAIVVGTDAWQVSRDAALDIVAGYTICNDVSDRGWQFEGAGQWTVAKSAPTFGPVGPWLVTTDEVGDASNLAIEMSVNDVTVQRSNTSKMIFSVPELIEHVTSRIALGPGDLITTGTPAGVGLASDRYLAPGDQMRLRIDRLGEMCQTVR